MPEPGGDGFPQEEREERGEIERKRNRLADIATREWTDNSEAKAVSEQKTEEREEHVVFVEGGGAKLIRPVGRKWVFRDDCIEFRDGTRSLIYGGRAIGEGDFHLVARLAITQESVEPTFVSGIEGEVPDFGRRRIGYMCRPVSEHQHLAIPCDAVIPGKPFTFEALRRGRRIVFKIDGEVFHKVDYTGPLGPVGFTVFPGGGTLRTYEFSVEGPTASLGDWKRVEGWRPSLPEVDIAEEKERQVVIMRGTQEIDYEHPSTVLMPDNKTMHCVWTIGHGGQSGPFKRSDDAGRTWSDMLEVPESWGETRNCPTIHCVVAPDGKARLIVFALDRDGGMVHSISEDDGEDWSEMEPMGLRATVPPIRVEPIDGGRRHLILYHREGNTYQSKSEDGGISWGDEQMVAAPEDCKPCEPDVIRSPDERQLTAIMREQWRAYNSMLITSDDEGKTWHSFREGNIAVTGDRHLGRFAPDGRLVIVFRDSSLDTPPLPDGRRVDVCRFIAWVGTYDDLVSSREGEYRIVLLRSKLGCGYPGLEVLPDGTFVATTYIGLEEGEQHSIVSTRFHLDELDRRVRET